MYDLIIIGGGPAGVGAGVYAARKKLKTLFLTAATDSGGSNFGGQSIVSEDVQNWIGTVSVSGVNLAKMLEEHLRAYAADAVEIHTEEMVTVVIKTEASFKITTAKDTYDTKTVLVCTGSHRRKLSAPGADIFEHKGITYCASCDGPLFSDRDVIVVGGGNAGFETAAQLLAYTKSVTLLDSVDKFRADPITVEKVLANPKMKAIPNADIEKIEGDKFVQSLTYKNKVSGESHTLPTGGIFVEIGLVPTTSFVEGVVGLNERKQIIADPRTQRTSVEGIWAAGDCTDVLYHQNNIAVGDAVRALEDIYIYLSRK
ncbi:MAG: Alkyl hydroperoxide reductase [Parcubacteria group bacterium Gr01-1014_48]|nr:MAG: Alkyl hydroperoxide reductase [Parcubacteria group bacterium Greene0416_14]TSC73711.1 MAG: Alkyl hydroperoxide reductase [Parcubacteria group bacterium Gr01-1014_48]TSC99557.1 MAG: Alkyl hydroperoxide reductase [Parcubacteria group bacterium Greene1014_15]TSD07034.1 MAG: Alkyl hydroperoxide reductase [Parcubacteria group bacterium Greene0714_4]